MKIEKACDFARDWLFVALIIYLFTFWTIVYIKKATSKSLEAKEYNYKSKNKQNYIL